jgi:hypothetical protein
MTAKHPWTSVSRSLRGRNPAVNSLVGNSDEQVSRHLFVLLGILAAQQRWQQIKDRTRRETPKLSTGESCLAQNQVLCGTLYVLS